MRSAGLALLFSSLSAVASAQNVVLVVIDGVRYTESFGGGHATIPFIWQILRPQGMIWENYWNNGVTYTCPGHASMETGTWQTIPNDGSERPTMPTIFEYFRKETGLPENSCVVITGKPKLDVLAYSTHPEYGEPYGASTVTGESDRAVVDSLRAVLERDRPRLVMVSLLGTDVAGHSGIFEDYLAALRLADSLAAEIWQAICDDPFYSGSTTLIVTNDHGRHDDEHGNFQHHGDACDGCRHLMLLALGRMVPADRVSTTERFQIDIASTVGSLLGFAAPYSQGSNILDDPVTGASSAQREETSDLELALHPNPFNGLARVTVTLRQSAKVRLLVFDILGRNVATLREGLFPAGPSTVTFDAGGLPSGFYAILAQSDAFSARAPVLLVK